MPNNLFILTNRALCYAKLQNDNCCIEDLNKAY